MAITKTAITQELGTITERTSFFDSGTEIHTVTVRMGETLFKKPVRPGHLIKIYGKVVRCGTTSLTVTLEARRHSPYNGSQVLCCTTSLVFVRVDGDGVAITISEKVKRKYEHLKYCDVKNAAKKN